MTSSGYKQSVSYAGETSYGSAATVDTPFGLVQSVNPTESNSLIKVRNLGGTRDYGAVVPGKFEVSGTMEYYLQKGAFIRHAIGEDTGTTNTIDSGPRIFNQSPKRYLHIMGSAESPGVDNFPSFTMEFADEENAAVNVTNLNRTYTGGRVDNLTISGNVDEPVKVNVDWKAAEVIASTGPATDVTAYTEDPYVFYQGNIYFTSGVIDSNTTQASMSNYIVANINSFECAIANNCESGWYLGGTTNSSQSLRGAKHIIPKGRDYSLKLGLHFSNSTMYRRFLGSDTATKSQSTLTKYTCVIDLVRAGKIGSVSGDADFMRMVFASASFDDINITGAPEDLVSEDISIYPKKAKFYVCDDVSSY